MITYRRPKALVLVSRLDGFLSKANILKKYGLLKKSNSMKKSLYMWLRIESYEDMQIYVEVSMSSMKLAIFDIKSFSFVDSSILYLLKKAGIKSEDCLFDDVQLMINVSSYKDVKVNLYIDKKCEADCSLRECVSAYGKPAFRPVLDIDDVPDVLKLLSYFMTEIQIKMAGIQFTR